VSQFPIAERAAFYHETLPYCVAVLPLADQRPNLERSGQKARGVFLLLWNTRIGDYTTKDEHFGSQVSAQLSEQVATYLRTSNAFAKVLPPSSLPGAPNPNDRASLAQLARTQAVDFFVTGEIEHFFGSQHQSSSVIVVPLSFVSLSSWQDSKSLPWGRTAIRFKLLEARSGDVLWSELLQADRTLPTDTDSMAQAAMESFVVVADSLAQSLRQLQLVVSEPATHPSLPQSSEL
jgi:hypothetical protein